MREPTAIPALGSLWARTGSGTRVGWARLLAVFLVLSLLAGLFAILHLFTSSPAPARVKLDLSVFEKLEPGMTEEEVMAIVSLPPGDYATRRVAYVGQGGVLVERGWEPKKWLFNSRSIRVYFEHGKIVYVERSTGVRLPTWIEEALDICVFPILIESED